MLWSTEKKHFYLASSKKFKTYASFQKIATSQGDDYTTGCLLDYQFFVS